MGVVGTREAGHSLAELADGPLQPRPQALLLDGADPAFDTSVDLPLAQKRRIVIDAAT
jgi:hypothetical protein